LAAALQQMGNKILLIDLDPQANLTQALGFLEEPEPTIYDMLRAASMGEETNIEEAILSTGELKLIPAALDLATAELELVSVYGREKLLTKLLAPIKKQYDYIFIDCPPAIGMLTVNALVASDFVLMPLQAEYLPLKGVHAFMQTFRKIKNQLNEQLQVLGFVLTKYNKRKNMNKSILQKLQEDYGDKVFETRIRENIALATAQEKGVDIYRFNKTSNGAIDYLKLAHEFLHKIN
ncbi:MAG: ParA family protein, partial [Bacteroidota bacterium]